MSITTNSGEAFSAPILMGFDVGLSDDKIFEQAILDTANLIRAKLGEDSTFVIIGLDPVDFTVTDAENRASGFTAREGRVNEIGEDVFFSGGGVIELLIIRDPSLANLTFGFRSSGFGVPFRGGGPVRFTGLPTNRIDRSTDNDSRFQ